MATLKELGSTYAQGVEQYATDGVSVVRQIIHIYRAGSCRSASAAQLAKLPRLKLEVLMMASPMFSLDRHVVHNSAAVAWSGALTIATPAIQWAYAVELLPQNRSDLAGAPGFIRLELDVIEGEIGVGCLGRDGQFLVEKECLPAGEREIVDLAVSSMSEIGSVIIRNRRAGGLASKACVWSVSLNVGVPSQQRIPEIIIDPSVFAPYKPWSGITPAGYWTDWLGVRTRVDVWQFSDEYLAVYNKERFETPEYPLDTEHALDWVPLLKAVNVAGNTFVIAALGAGWGRWLSAGAFAAVQTGRQYRLVGVEAEPTHFSWMQRHLEDNRIRSDWSRLMRAAASDSSGQCWFRVGNSAAWYGQSILEDASSLGIKERRVNLWDEVGANEVRLQRIPSVDVEDVIGQHALVDYIHMDIQGSELDFLSAKPKVLQQRVKMVNIGTHSATIERNLRSYFKSLGWRCIYDIPMNARVSIRLGEEGHSRLVSFGDGVQVWVNLICGE